MCESGCRPVLSTSSSSRPDAVVGLGGQLATQSARAFSDPGCPTVSRQHVHRLSSAFRFTEKYCGEYQHPSAWQLLLSLQLSVHLSIIHHLPFFLSSIYLLSFLSYPSCISHPLSVIYLSIHHVCLLYHVSVIDHPSFIHCVLPTCPLTVPITHPPTHSSSMSLSCIYHLSAFCHPLSMHPS